jgi:hypothetical protein
MRLITVALALTLALAPSRGSSLRLTTFEHIDGAAPLLLKITEHPADLESREKLADLYRRANYPSAAGFFAATAQVLKRQAVTAPRAPAPSSWVYRQAENCKDDTKPAQLVDELISGGEYLKAVKAARDAITQCGLTGQLVVEWAYAVQCLASADRSRVSAEDRELAIRLFITGFEEMHDYPVNSWNKVVVYRELSGFFSLAHDPVSAYAAAVIARDHLQDAGEQAGWIREMRASIEQQIQRLTPLLPRRR